MKLILQTILIITAWNFSYASEKYNLVYVEHQGCEYCEIWDDEISAIYPKTPEGKFAPLLRLDITNYETEMSDVKPVIFTPVSYTHLTLPTILRV